MSSTMRSVCPYDCPDACGLLVNVADGKAVSVSGDPYHPVTKGLLCGKMKHYEQTVHSEQRLLTPLRRTGSKGSGQFEPISWHEAIRTICSNWQKIINDHGAESILPYSYAGTMGLIQRNAGHAFFHKLGASRLERTICSPAKEAGWKALMGDTPAMNPDEIINSDLIIMWGINAAATSIHTMHDAKKAQRNGARLWAIDTYRTPTCDAADESFILRPGSDGALALGILHVIERDGLLNKDFIAGNVSGFTELTRDVLPHCTPEQMSAICGIPTDSIIRIAHAYASAKAPFIRLGSGLTRYGNGAMTVRTICCLPAAVGAWSKTGGGIFLGTSTGAAFPIHKITREDFISGTPRSISMNQLGDALTKLTSPEVMSLYVYHSNPAAIAPDQNAVITGLQREDLFTVVHERFLTDTALYADIVLPATTSLEHPDIYRSYGNYHAQRCAAVINTVGDAKSNLEVFSLLAEEMGFKELFFRQSADELIDTLLAESSPWCGTENTLRLKHHEPIILKPLTEPKSEWQTPSGLIEVYNPLEREPLPRLLATHAESDGFPLRLQSAVTPFALNSSFYEQDNLRSRQNCMELMMNNADAAARNLENGQEVEVFNSLGRVNFKLTITDRVPSGTVVTEGVWWLQHIPGERGVNALTSQRLTDSGRGSTLYDSAVEVKGMRISAE